MVDEGGYGTARCGICGKEFYFDIFEYENVEEVYDEKRKMVVLKTKCPHCETCEI
jgi:hypothetical protein